MEEKYTKESLIEKFKEIKSKGWIAELPKRENNTGGPGNTLEDLFGIKENNLSLPDIGIWELKTHKVKSQALLTLIHHDPKPEGKSIVSKYLLPNFGWPHKQAGIKYPVDEKSFRQTLNAERYTDRGFKIGVDYTKEKINLDFDPMEISDSSQAQYKVMLSDRFDLPIEDVQIDSEDDPYWDFEDLDMSMERKLKDAFLADYMERSTDKGKEIKYVRFYMLEEFNFQNFLDLLNSKNSAFVDFDARSHHNHGVKFRIRKNLIPQLYKKCTIVVK